MLIEVSRYSHRTHTPCHQSAIAVVPTDILLEVIKHLPLLSDRLSFSKSSAHIYSRVIASIYSSVELNGIDQCNATLSMLATNSSCANLVKKLVVRPEHSTDCGQPFKAADASSTAQVVSLLVSATSRRLRALRSFTWESEYSLPNDAMWSDLRRWCRNLKTIGTTIGCSHPSPDSALFAFRDLESFSLTFKDGYHAHRLEFPCDESSCLFTSLWDMLVHRCPDLQTLSITGTCNQLGHESRFLAARWPKLKSLAIGDIIDVAFSSLGVDEPISTHTVGFLEGHPSLETVNLSTQSHVLPLDLGALSVNALPNLRSFSGSLAHLRALATRGSISQQIQQYTTHETLDGPSNPYASSALASTLQSVCLLEPLQLRQGTASPVAFLQGFRHLISLEMTVVLQGDYHYGSVLRGIVSACPGLIDLTLTCAGRPSFHLGYFSTTIGNLRKLTKFSLSIVKASGEQAMRTSAVQIARYNPQLQSFSVAFLPRMRTLAVRSGNSSLHALEHGEYEVVKDTQGVPVTLLARERSEGRWITMPHFLTRASNTRQYTRWRAYDLRPQAGPEFFRGSWYTTVLEANLVVSKAGLIAICVLSLIVATACVVRAEELA